MRVKCESICSEPIGRFNVPNELGWLTGKRILLLRNSACIGWLEGEAEEGGVFAERTLLHWRASAGWPSLPGSNAVRFLIMVESMGAGLWARAVTAPSGPGKKRRQRGASTACPITCGVFSESRGELERRGAGRTASLVALPVHDVLHVLNAQHDRDTLIKEFRAVGGTRIMA